VASLIIRLRVDPATKKRDVIVSYTSDADALPLEHEEDHRRLVDRLIEGGALKASEVGRVVIERRGPEAEAAAEPRREEPVAEPTPVGRGRG
jgi:hypothetical protein